jgi:capsular exopolysaccharide synthesis family protein
MPGLSDYSDVRALAAGALAVTNHSLASIEESSRPASAPPSLDSKGPLLRSVHELLLVMRRRWRVAASILGIIAGALAVEHFAVAPLYKSVITVCIDSSTPVIPGVDTPALQAVDPLPVRQSLVLRSMPVLLKVVEDLKLQDRWHMTASQAARRLADNVNTRLSRYQDAVQVEACDADRELPVSLADALVAAYQQRLIERVRTPAMQMQTSLQAQIDKESAIGNSLRTQAEQLRSQLASRIISTPTSMDQQAARFADRIAAAQSELAATQQRLDAISEAAKDSDARAVAGLLNDQQASAIVQKLRDSELGESASASEYGSDHPVLRQQSLARIVLERELRERVAQVIDTIKLDRDAKHAQLASLEEQFAQTQTSGGKSDPLYQQYLAAQDAADRQVRLCDALRDRAQRVAIALAMPVSPLQVVDRSGHAELKLGHRLSDTPWIAGLGAVLLAVFGAVMVDQWNSSVKADSDIVCATAAPVLATICGQARLLEESEPWSAQLESYRALVSRLGFAAGVRELKSLAVVSALAGEGRTHIAANLAILHAAAGKRVLLVEADFRRPMLASLLGAEPDAPGLLDWLDEAVSFDELACETSAQNVYLISAGSRNQIAAPTPQQLAEFAHLASADFDVVIYDTPPLLESADAAIFARDAGSALLVVKPDTASLDELRQAAGILNQAGSRILGAAFNRMTSIPRSTILRENRPELQYRLARNHISQSRIEPAQRRKAA